MLPSDFDYSLLCAQRSALPGELVQLTSTYHTAVRWGSLRARLFGRRVVRAGPAGRSLLHFREWRGACILTRIDFA